jgi:class 3 adenylate cyclase
MMIERSDPQQGSLVALLQLAAELERRPVRPDEAELRDLRKRLSLDARTVLAAVRLRYGQEPSPGARSAVARAVGRLGRSLRALAARVGAPYARRPYLSAGLLTVALGIAFHVCLLVGGNSLGAGIAVLTLVGGYSFVLAALSYSMANVRTAAGVALLVSCLWLVGVLVLMALATVAGSVQLLPGGAVTIATAASVALAFAFVPLLTFVAAAGGYARTLRKLKTERDADRQSLLRRVFDLSAKLDERQAESNGTDSGHEETQRLVAKLADRFPSLIAFVSRRVVLATFLFYLAVLLVDNTLIAAANVEWAPVPGRVGLVPVAIGMFVAIIVFLGFFQLGAVAASLRKAVWMVLATGAAAFLGELFSFLFCTGPYGTPGGSSPPVWVLMAIGSMARMLVNGVPIVAGAMAGAHRAFIERERLLAVNDRPALVAEITRLRSRLREDARHATFLCVDVVGSTLMKQGADMLAVEYSFTEYQRYVAAHVIERGGAIHSTAGDGAVAVFHDVQPALEAGLAMQRDLDDFNSTANTLGWPFRLRIGIHAGRVPGTGSGVAYSEVLDVASHVERACPPGSVMLTRDAAEFLGDLPPLVDHPEMVDGRSVAVVQLPHVGSGPTDAASGNGHPDG